MQIWPYPSTASDLSKTPLFWHSRTFTIHPQPFLSSSFLYCLWVPRPCFSSFLMPTFYPRLHTLHSLFTQHCFKRILQYWVTVIPFWIFLDQSLHSFQRNFPRNKCPHVVSKGLTQGTKPPERIISWLHTRSDLPGPVHLGLLTSRTALPVLTKCKAISC